MNLLGKILVVLIFTMSLVFMSFAVAVYSTHTNWRMIVKNTKENVSINQPLGLESVLAQAENEIVRKNDEMDRLTLEYKEELLIATDSLAKLETERLSLKGQVEMLQTKNVELTQIGKQQLTAMTTIQARLDAVRKETDRLRTEIIVVEKSRNEHAKEILQLTDVVNGLQNDKIRLTDREKELAYSLAEMLKVMRMHGLDEKVNYKSETPWGNPKGVVTAVRPKGSIELSIGSDDGLQKGHKFNIVRFQGGSGKLVGQCVIVQITPDKSIAKIDLKTLRVPVQKFDRVMPLERTLKRN